MAGLCGWFGIDSSLMTTDERSHVLSKYDHCSLDQAIASDAGVVVARSNGLAQTYQDEGIICGIHGQYHWRDKELDKICKTDGPGKALAYAYRQHRDKVPLKLSGRFSLAIIEPGKKNVLVANDKIGIEPVNYTTVGNKIIFSSNIDFIKNASVFESIVSPQAIFNYYFFHQIPAERTIYEKHKRLLPGSMLEFGDGRIRHKQYWKPEFQQHEYASTSFEELNEEFLDILETSVSELNTSSTGAFLSGGTDSSTVVGMMSRSNDKAPSTYSIGFDAEGYDEMEYARITSKHFSSEHHEYYVTPNDIVNIVPEIAEIYSEPFGNSSAVPTYYCAKMAKEHNIGRLLAGDGGDELFAGNERYAKQKIFSMYESIPTGLKNSISNIMQAGLYPDSVFPFNKMKSYVEQASVPMPDRLQTYNLLNRLGIGNIFSEDFVSSIDSSQPYKEYSEIYNSVSADAMLNKMLALDFKYTLADNDLPKVTRMCELAGVEAAFPLLSDELLEFSLRVPTKLKLKGKYLRYFFKKALTGFLPNEVIVKKKQGFGLPFGQWVLNNKGLNDLVRDSLETLKGRGIVNVSFIDELFNKNLPAYPHYYGEMVWLLMMFEWWYRKHVDA